MMTRTLAIDVARGSRQNLAPRGELYRWARIVSVDPSVFDEVQQEALGRSLDFLEGASKVPQARALAADHRCNPARRGNAGMCTDATVNVSGTARP